MAITGSSIARDFFPITAHATNPVGGAGTTYSAYGICSMTGGVVTGKTRAGGVTLRTVTLAAGQIWPVEYTHVTVAPVDLIGFTIQS